MANDHDSDIEKNLSEVGIYESKYSSPGSEWTPYDKDKEEDNIKEKL